MVHRRLVGPDSPIKELVSLMREHFPSEEGRARRIAINTLKYFDGSLTLTKTFLMRGARAIGPTCISWVAPAEGVEEELSPHVNCSWDNPCEGCSGQTMLL